jgi:uncharacterized protein (DUF952 family)
MENYTTIYKILTLEEWSEFETIGEFRGTSLDVKDGYIHMSKNMDQVNRVKNKYYKDTKIVLVHIDPLLLPASDFRYELISNGDTYPHLYNTLLTKYIIKYELL